MHKPKARSEAVVVESYDLRVPCRRFAVFANVTRDQGLPVVDEFVLRLLRLVERLPPRKIGEFFGFSRGELEATLSDLVARGLIVVNANEVELHPSTDDMFRISSDGAPVVTTTEQWAEGVWFDLVSRNIMRPERSRSASNLVAVETDKLSRELPASYAKQAFELNFVDYVRSTKRVPDPDRLSLYSVSGVEAGRFGFVTFRIEEKLSFSPTLALDWTLPDFAVEQYSKFRLLAEAISKSLHMLRPQPATKASWNDVGRLTGLRPTGARAENDWWFDPEAWLLNVPSSDRSREFTPLLGAPYLARNANAFASAVQQELSTRSFENARSSPEIVWLRPGGTGWGRTLDLTDAVQTIRNAVRPFWPKGRRVSSTLISSDEWGRDEQSFSRIFDQGRLKRDGGLDEAVEIMLLRGVGAMVGTRAALSASVTIPVCAMTTSRRAVNRIESILDQSIDRLRAPIWTLRKEGPGLLRRITEDQLD